MAKVPLILDTDIGDDIDDAWALAYLLSQPHCDLRLVVTAFGDRERHLVRARIVQKFLALSGRSDVPVALGVPSWGGKGSSTECGMQRWAESVDGFSAAVSEVPMEEDGVGAMIRVIERSPEPVTLLSIGPLGNVAALLDRAGDSIACKARLVGMHGSIFRGYSGGEPPSAEHNVVCDSKACARALAAPWCIAPLLAPLDTCMAVQLKGSPLQQLYAEDAPALSRLLLEANNAWMRDSSVATRHYAGIDPKTSSTILFDTLAAYLALQPAGGGMLELTPLRLEVTEDGRMLPSEATAAEAVCALQWKAGGLEAFCQHLVEVLVGREGAKL